MRISVGNVIRLNQNAARFGSALKDPVLLQAQQALYRHVWHLPQHKVFPSNSVYGKQTGLLVFVPRDWDRKELIKRLTQYNVLTKKDDQYQFQNFPVQFETFWDIEPDYLP